MCVCVHDCVCPCVCVHVCVCPYTCMYVCVCVCVCVCYTPVHSIIISERECSRHGLKICTSCEERYLFPRWERVDEATCTT